MPSSLTVCHDNVTHWALPYILTHTQAADDECLFPPFERKHHQRGQIYIHILKERCKPCIVCNLSSVCSLLFYFESRCREGLYPVLSLPPFVMDERSFHSCNVDIKVLINVLPYILTHKTANDECFHHLNVSWRCIKLEWLNNVMCIVGFICTASASLFVFSSRKNVGSEEWSLIHM